jgi:hypothetical protein
MALNIGSHIETIRSNKMVAFRAMKYASKEWYGIQVEGHLHAQDYARGDNRAIVIYGLGPNHG